MSYKTAGRGGLPFWTLFSGTDNSFRGTRRLRTDSSAECRRHRNPPKTEKSGKETYVDKHTARAYADSGLKVGLHGSVHHRQIKEVTGHELSQ